MYAHLLIATDGSELAGRAVAHGVKLARQLGARVTFVSATETWPSIDMGAMPHHADQGIIDAFETAVREAALETLANAGAVAEDAGVSWDSLHVPGRRAAEAIVEAAAAGGCDLIVMASHGRRGVRRLLLGSQTVEVLTSTEVPVLVVR